MAVQEALILLLRAASPSSGFTQVSLALSPCLCVRVAFPWLLSPPLSLIPLSASLRLSEPSSFLFLVLSCSFRFAVSLFAPLVSFTGQDKVGYSFYYTQKGFCVSLLACLVGCFFLLLSPPLVFFLVLPRCPHLSLAGACVVGSTLWQAERRKMKAQSSKMHQHEY